MKKVLIVDDDSINRYMLETLLKGYGFEVISAENGEDALDKARLNHPDLIVTDILMPVMDGYALCRRWKSDDTLKHIPLVFYTATYTGSKNEDFALSLGADRFILKPQEPDILMNILKEVLEEKYTARQTATKPLEEEMEFFRQYNEILFKKLEKKMSDLQIANQELRILEERYRLSFENVSDVIYTIDMDLNIISISPSVERILGYKTQNFIGRPASDLGHILTPESFKQAVADIALVLRGETIPATIYQFIAKDGTIKHGEVSRSPLMREGRIIGMISVARDVTDRKQAEDTFHETQDLLNEVGGIARIGGWKMNLINRKATWTQGTYDIVEITPGVPIPGPDEHVDYYLPEYRPLVVEAMRALIEDDKPLDFEAQLRTAKGNVRWCRAMGRAVREGGKAVEVYGTFQDITERKRAEEALRESAEKYRRFFMTSRDCVFVTSKEGSWIDMNDAAVELFGYSSREELMQVKIPNLYVNPEERTKHGSIIAEHGYSKEFPVDLRRKDGNVMHTLITSIALCDAEGNVIGFQGTIRDITERKQAEELYKTLAENSLAAVFIVQDGKFRFINSSAVAYAGYTAKELIGLASDVIVHPEDRKVVRNKGREMLQGRGTSPYEYRMVAKDGQIKWIMQIASPIQYEGKPAILGNAIDITERRQADEKLKNQMEFMTTLLDTIPSPVFYKDAWGKYLGCNLAFEEFYGMSREEITGKSVYDIAPAEIADKYAEKDQELFERPGSQMYEWKVKKADGSERDVIFNKATFKDSGGGVGGLVGIIVDITERKQAEEQLQKTLGSLRKAIGTTIQVMVSAVETRDPYTAGHQIRSAGLARAIAMEMMLSQEIIDGIRMAGSIHDIGKLSIPAEILSKPTKLSEIELRLIKEHALHGYEILKDVESPWPLAEMVYQHHERMDGSGYPRNLKGDDILMEARILAVADVVESMASHRPYRPALGIDAALEEIENNRGILYDAAVVDACLRLFREKGFAFS